MELGERHRNGLSLKSLGNISLMIELRYDQLYDDINMQIYICDF